MGSNITSTTQFICDEGLIAIVRGSVPAAKLLEIGDALLASPVLVMAVTINGTDALDAIALLRQRFGEHVLVGAGTVFTNDRYPRAASTDLRRLRSSAPDEHTLPTRVREGATIGARATIGCDLVIGRFAMIGMGALVTRSVGDFLLAVGHPARPVGCVCRCGRVLAKFTDAAVADADTLVCEECNLRYALQDREGGGEDNLVRTFSVADFNGQDAASDWTLVVRDLAGIDTGTLNTWRVVVVTAE